MDYIELSPEEQNAVKTALNYTISPEDFAKLSSDFHFDTINGIPVNTIIDVLTSDDEDMTGWGNVCDSSPKEEEEKKKKKEEEEEEERKKMDQDVVKWANNLDPPICYKCEGPMQLYNCGWSGTLYYPVYHAEFECAYCGMTSIITF